MKTIPPAETFIINKLDKTQPNENKPPTPKEVEEWLIEFAKLHVTEALKQASEKFKINLFEPNINEVRENILKSYSLHNVE